MWFSASRNSPGKWNPGGDQLFHWQKKHHIRVWESGDGSNLQIRVLEKREQTEEQHQTEICIEVCVTVGPNS